MLTAEFKVNGKRVGLVNIHNDGTGTPWSGNYTVTMFEENSNPVAFASIVRWPRQQRKAWQLVLHALKGIDRKRALLGSKARGRG